MSRKTKLTLGYEDDELFIPSTHPSTKEDINDLEQRFHMQLYKELALENGLCPKRRCIYDDLFNELIRVTKIECSERGNVLQRIKDEYQQWMNTYEELYSSSMAYGIRQYLYKMEEKKNLELTIEDLEIDCKRLRNELELESIRFQNVTEKLKQNSLEDDKDMRILNGNVNFLRSANHKLQKDLENVLNEILSSPIFLGDQMNLETRTIK